MKWRNLGYFLFTLILPFNKTWGFRVFINMILFKLYEPMKNHLSFACGGEAKFFTEPKTIDEFTKTISECKRLKRKYFILGNGTNTLCPDEGYNGVVISTKALNNILLTKYNDKVFITLEAGVSLFKLNKLLADLGIEGLEWSYGIPGSIGGAVFMNAGAYGHDIFEFVDYVVVYSRGKSKKIKKEQIKYSYRNGGLNGKVILKVGLKLICSCPRPIREKQLYYMKKRIESQPLDYPSAGSVYKRQDKNIPAEIIDKLGLKGAIIGGAKVSEKHAGFIINTGHATTKNILDLMEKIEAKVLLERNIKLEREIKLMS